MDSQPPTPDQDNAASGRQVADESPAENRGSRTVLFILIVLAIALAILLAVMVVDYLNLRSELADEAFGTSKARSTGR